MPAAGGSTRAEVECVAVVRPFASGPEANFHLTLRDLFPKAEIVVVEHHQAHAASAYFASPFEEATILTLDHFGDFCCGARWRGRQNQIGDGEGVVLSGFAGPACTVRVTRLLGFRAGADEHKVQWLSASGDDRFVPLVSRDRAAGRAAESRRSLTASRQSGGGFSALLYERLGLDNGAEIPASLAPSVARGAQEVVQECAADLAGDAENLCLAGGLFFNALLVQHFESSNRWKRVFVQAAAGNAGTALGAVFHAWHQVRRHTRRTSDGSLLLGPSYTAEEIKQVLENCKLRFQFLRSVDEMLVKAVNLLGDHKILAWMQGRMEFGPRALGNRSILASPLDPYSTENLNIFIKHREPFRKFAASVPAERAAEYFEVGPNACNLATVGRVRPEHRKTFESAILGAESGRDLVRVHTVSEASNPLFHRLLLEAGKATGLPVLYNTSFNLFGDSLVSTPRDAVRSFYSSGIDAMFVGNFLLEK